MMFGKPSNEPKPETEFPSLAAEPEPAPVPVPKPVERIDTIIGEGTRILGTLHCKTLLRVKKDTLPDLPGMKDLMETKIPEI